MSSVDSGWRVFDRCWQTSMEEPIRVLRRESKFKSLRFVCSPSFFSLPAACRLFSRGVIFTRARVSFAPLSLRKNGGLLVVYHTVKWPSCFVNNWMSMRFLLFYSPQPRSQIWISIIETGQLTSENQMISSISHQSNSVCPRTEFPH